MASHQLAHLLTNPTLPNPLFTERDMVQHERPSGNDHVRFGMVSSSLLRRHGHRLDHHGRDTQNCGRNLRSARVLLFGLSRQNILVRSRIDPDTSHTDREATAAPRFA